jgi:uncharacterized protein YcbX
MPDTNGENKPGRWRLLVLAAAVVGMLVLAKASGWDERLGDLRGAIRAYERAAESFGMDRFRPNLTVDADPWVEDTWRDVSIGAARLGVGLAWPRCAIPQIDQIDGTRHREPAKVLKAHRWCSHAPSVPAALRPVLEGNALFGIACSVDDTNEPGATVAVGDEVIVHRTGPRIIDAPQD